MRGTFIHDDGWIKAICCNYVGITPFLDLLGSIAIYSRVGFLNSTATTMNKLRAEVRKRALEKPEEIIGMGRSAISNLGIKRGKGHRLDFSRETEYVTVLRLNMDFDDRFNLYCRNNLRVNLSNHWYCQRALLRKI